VKRNEKRRNKKKKGAACGDDFQQAGMRISGPVPRAHNASFVLDAHSYIRIMEHNLFDQIDFKVGAFQQFFFL
jgi:hypothetical protein